MASLIDLLGLGAGAVVGARTAQDERIREQRATEQQGLLDRIKAEQEAQDREMQRKLQEAQIRNFESLAQERQQPSSSPGARAQYDPARGGWVLPPDEQNPQGQFVVPQGITPRPAAPRAPVRGTPEYDESIRREAQIRAEAQANQPTGTERARVEQQQRAFRNVKSALDRFEQGVARGITVMPGAQKSALETEYEGLQLQLKELFNLGVLNGPDLELMRRIINNPSGLSLNAQRALGVKPEDVLREQISRVRTMIQDYENNLSPQGSAPAAPASVIDRYQLERPE